MALDPAAMQASIIRNLPARTGLDLDGWLRRLAAEGPTDAKARVAWLKGRGVGHVTAQVIVQHADVGAAYVDGTDGFLATLFGPAGTDLRDRYEALHDELVDLVPGTRVSVCKGYVGFAAARQHAAVRSRTGRLQVGLRLPADGGLLLPVRGFGGGAITSAFLTDGPLDEAQRDAVRRAASVVKEPA